VEVNLLQCASDSQSDRQPGEPGQTSYHFCIGDSLVGNDALKNPRGMFGYYSTTKMASITDGTSNTIAVSEAVKGKRNQAMAIRGSAAFSVLGADTNPSICLALRGEGGLYRNGVMTRPWVGTNWEAGAPVMTGFVTVLPPNSPSCLFVAPMLGPGIGSATSYHPGGVNSLYADGSVQFTSETIDSGQVGSPEVRGGPSPYGVWGALGSINGGETSGGGLTR
jgi:prepilin-type processing-associated H-X9-DG protein